MRYERNIRFEGTQGMHKKLLFLLMAVVLIPDSLLAQEDQFDVSQLLLGGTVNIGNTSEVLPAFALKWEDDQGVSKWRLAATHRLETSEEGQTIALLEYEHLLGERFYISGQADFERDGNADLKYQVILSPAIGYYVLRDEHRRLSFEVAPGYLFQERGDSTFDSILPLLGNRFIYLCDKTSGLRFFQSSRVLIPGKEPEQFLIDAILGLDYPLSEKWLLVFQAENFYRNKPNRGKSNDLNLTASIAYNFSR